MKPIILFCLVLVVMFTAIGCERKLTKSPETAKPIEPVGPIRSLHRAAAQGDVGKIKLLIAKGTDVNVKDNGGYTPLFYAVWKRDVDMAILFISNGAEVNMFDGVSCTPLHYAVWSADTNMVELLIGRGANISAEDRKGKTPLQYAVTIDRQGLVDLLVTSRTWTPTIHLAAAKGDLARVKSFIEEGTDVDTKDKIGWTPLLWAALTGQEDVAEFLIAKGANIDTKTNDNCTLLHQAAKTSAAKLVELLISKGADVNDKNNNGGTPLHGAAFMGHRNVVELLIAKGANVNAENNQGRTALGLAEQRGHTGIVELLRKLGTDAKTLIIHVHTSQNSLNLKAIYGSNIKEYSISPDIEASSKLEYLFRVLAGEDPNKEKYGDVNDLLTELGECIYGPIDTFVDSASEIEFVIKEEMVKYPFDVLRYKETQLFLHKPVFYSFEQSPVNPPAISTDSTGLIVSDLTADPERGCLLVRAMFPSSTYFDIWALTPQDIEKMENPDFILISTHGQISGKGNDIMTLGDEKLVPKNFSGKRPKLVYFDSCNLGVSLEFINVFRSGGTFYYLGPILSNEAGNSSTKTIDFFFKALLEGATPPSALFKARKALYETFSSQDDFYRLMYRAFPFRVYQLN